MRSTAARRGGRRIAAIKDVVVLLPGHRLDGQPAEIARAELQHAHRDQLLALGHGDDVRPLGVDLAVMVELDDGDAVGLVGRQVDRPHREELGAAACGTFGPEVSRR